MLRVIVVLLLLANAAYFAWTQNWLAAAGLPAAAARSPAAQAVQEPLNPQQLQLISPQQLEQALQQNASAKPAAAPSPAPAAAIEEPEPATNAPPQAAVQAAVPPAGQPVAAPRVCMATGTFTQEQLQPIRAALQGWPAEAWRVEESTLQGRWMVFWGNFDDGLVFAAKRSELEAKQLAFDPLRNTPQGTGFSLGRFSTEAAANQERERLARRGINGLAVVKEREDTTVFNLEFPDYDAYRERIRRELARFFTGKPLRAC